MIVVEDQKPRRDGLIEAIGTWGEVTVGARLALTPNRTDIWEVTDTKAPDQWEYGHTSWFQVVEQGTGVTRAVKPKLVNHKVKILLGSPDETLPPRQPVGDADEVYTMLTTIMGPMQEIYTQDRATGEVWCPWDFAGPDGELRHLRDGHNVDTAALEAIDAASRRITEAYRLHGQAHNPKYAISKGGFPHRHIPEDHSIL